MTENDPTEEYEPNPWMDGYKTYLVAFMMILFVVAGLALGYIDMPRAFEIFMEALGLMGLRRAITTIL